MRPRTLTEFVGQNIWWTGPSAAAADSKAAGRCLHDSVGSPGTARPLWAAVGQKKTDARFNSLSAVFSGVKDLRARDCGSCASIVNAVAARFCSSMNSSLQQSAAGCTAACCRNGTVTLIGATTENHR